MERVSKTPPKTADALDKVRSLYDLSTPMLDQFIRAARKRVRFPRYYKKAVNW